MDLANLALQTSRNLPQGLNISSIRVYHQIRDPEIPINLRPPLPIRVPNLSLGVAGVSYGGNVGIFLVFSPGFPVSSISFHQRSQLCLPPISSYLSFPFS